MSIRCVVDKGKQFNCIQSGSFEYRCAALQDLQLRMVQAGWHAATKQKKAGPVLSAHTSVKIKKLALDKKRKDTMEYKS